MGTVSVRIISAKGTPLARVAVTLSGSDSIIISQPPVTDRNGNTTGVVRCASPGQYKITAQLATHLGRAAVPSGEASVQCLDTVATEGAQSTFSALPSVVAADGYTTAQLRVVVHDSQGQPLAGRTVTLDSTGTHNVFGAAQGLTGSDGVFTTTLASDVAEDKDLMAQVDAATLHAFVTFSNDAASALFSTLTATPSDQVADGASIMLVQLNAVGPLNNPLPSLAVQIQSTGTGNAFQPTSGATDVNGVFASNLTSTRAESKTLTALVEGTPISTAAAFHADAPSALTSSFTSQGGPAAADGVAYITLSVSVLDAQGNPVPNQSVLLGSTTPGTVFTPISGNTDTLGIFHSTVASTTAGTQVLSATVGTAVLTTPVTFVAG